MSVSGPTVDRLGRRCALLLRLAALEGQRGHTTEACALFAAAECEARRADRPDLAREARRACERLVAAARHPARRRPLAR